jgi:2-polyprenyl-6-methoxyphenol hydroxylase-like FAD-dependent oxidoreductase
MKLSSILVVGGGIGGLTSAIALGQRGFKVEIIEKDPAWSVYGVGIIQQGNVVRAVAALGIIDDYLDASFGYDHVEVYLPNGNLAARIPSPRLVPEYPSQLGISRRALQKVLADRAKAVGTNIHLGVVVESMKDDGSGVNVTFSNGTSGRYDLVIGADGLYSQIREMIFPDAPKPQFIGQSVWRYTLRKTDDVTGLCAYEGPIGMGLVPLSDQLMYMYVTTPEPGNPRYPREGIARAMREKLTAAPPRIAELREQITEDDGVVYKPLEWYFLDQEWHKGRIVLIGDAAHGTTPHLGQGAGMAIEDSVVLAEELERTGSVEQAFAAFQQRRFERCKYIVDSSVAICKGQLGLGPRVDQARATAEMFRVTAEPI